MTRPDDCTLTKAQRRDVKSHAQRALEKASAFGRFPTPVEDIVAASNVTLAAENVLREDFLSDLRGKGSPTLKLALSKVWGVLDVRDRIAYIDRDVHTVKQRFLGLHETAHAVLPWQLDLFSIIEDCELSIAPDVADAFDREASVFASDVLFQLDAFTKDARDLPLTLQTPIKLSKRYGASVYASARRFVVTHELSCALLVLNPVEPGGPPFSATLRREESFPSFRRVFGEVTWPERIRLSDDGLGSVIPVGARKMVGPLPVSVRDKKGKVRPCLAESFATGFQVFVLILPV